MSYVGIENVNEFYTHHYLTSMVGGALKDTAFSWRDTQDPPDRASKRAHRDFFSLREVLIGLYEPSERRDMLAPRSGSWATPTLPLKSMWRGLRRYLGG